ncbi:hypothetical protein [Legionella tunisiensis]|uniref:hypothetical protein n=1 Tax=Legionella tunisiensis TaxID=1034944 RepID=UPI0012EAF8CD|nr:hypothetical protein [Legionella tunisiensis]
MSPGSGRTGVLDAGCAEPVGNSTLLAVGFSIFAVIGCIVDTGCIMPGAGGILPTIGASITGAGFILPAVVCSSGPRGCIACAVAWTRSGAGCAVVANDCWASFTAFSSLSRVLTISS